MSETIQKQRMEAVCAVANAIDSLAKVLMSSNLPEGFIKITMSDCDTGIKMGMPESFKPTFNEDDPTTEVDEV